MNDTVESVGEIIDFKKIAAENQTIVAAAHRMRIAPSEFIIALVESFPCLVGKWQGKWDVAKFVKYSGAWSSGERYAALFVASVWNPYDAKRRRGWTFNVVEALGTWDSGNRRAFLNWAANPYWP